MTVEIAGWLCLKGRGSFKIVVALHFFYIRVYSVLYDNDMINDHFSFGFFTMDLFYRHARMLPAETLPSTHPDPP